MTVYTTDERATTIGPKAAGGLMPNHDLITEDERANQTVRDDLLEQVKR